MKILEQKDKYLRIIKDILFEAKRLGATDAQVCLNASMLTSVTARKGSFEKLENENSRDLLITVYKGYRKGYVNLSALDKNSINLAIEKAIQIADIMDIDEAASLPKSEFLAKEYADLDLLHYTKLSTEEMIEIVKMCDDCGFEIDKRIINSEGSTMSVDYSSIFIGNSRGFIGDYAKSIHSFASCFVAASQSSMQRDYDYIVSRMPINFAQCKQVAISGAEKTIKRLDSRNAPFEKETLPILFDNEVAIDLISSFLKAISGSNLYKKTSFLTDSIGKMIFPSWLTIEERATDKNSLGSAPFDLDGIATNNKYIIQNGELKSYLLDNYSANRLKLSPTGNAGGYHKILLNNMNQTKEEIISNMSKGLLITETLGQGVNLITGDYSKGAFGYWIENGDVKYPIEGITIAGNLQDIFKNIVSIGTDANTKNNIQTGSILIKEMAVAGAISNSY